MPADAIGTRTGKHRPQGRSYNAFGMRSAIHTASQNG